MSMASLEKLDSDKSAEKQESKGMLQQININVPCTNYYNFVMLHILQNCTAYSFKFQQWKANG